MKSKVEKILKACFKKKISITMATIVVFLLTNGIANALIVSQDKTFSAGEIKENLEVKNTSIYDEMEVVLEKGVKINSNKTGYALTVEGVNQGKKINSWDVEAPDTTLNSKGNLSIIGESGIEVKGFNPKIKVDGENSQIVSNGTAILFGVSDVEFFDGSLPMKNVGQSIELKNTVIRTNNKTASLIVADAKDFTKVPKTIDGEAVYDNIQAPGDALLSLSGKNTFVEAPENGWLAETNYLDGYIKDNQYIKSVGADLTIVLQDGAKIKGLTKQNYNKLRERKQITSSLEINIMGGAWELAPKKDLVEQKATLGAVYLDSNGVLDAGKNKTGNGKAEYKITTFGGSSASASSSYGLGMTQKLKYPGVSGERKIVPISPYSAGGNEYDEDYDYGIVYNKTGIITLANDSYEDKLTLESHYLGGNGNLLVNTLWNSPGDTNGGNSKSDLLHIMGDAYGETKVIAVSKDGKAGYIDGTIGEIAADLNKNSAVVVRVDGRSFKEIDFEDEDEIHDETVADENYVNFTGTARTKGAGQLQLANRKTANGGKEYFWTLTALTGGTVDKKSEEVAAIITGTNTNNSGTNTSNSGTNTTNTGGSIYLLNPEVSSYVQTPKINMDMAYSSIRTLHERRGENSTIFNNKGVNENPIWARIFTENNKVKGKNRFEYKTDIDAVQVGYDLNMSYDENNGYRLDGAYFTYAQADSKFYDKYNALNGKIIADKFTGKAKSEMFAFGLTSTKYNKNGLYIDLVSQLAFYRNKYQNKDIEDTKQKGYGFVLSGEIGKAITLEQSTKGRFVLEPQAQLSYQYLDLKKFNDGVREIDSNDQYGLRGRLGFRLAYHNLSNIGRTFYTVANITENFLNSKSVKIYNDQIKEKYGKTIGDIGLGIQLPISDKSHIYGDVRYEHSLNGDKYKGYRGTLGIKYIW
ncbi:MAG: autotransporter outer membrane beta-barrel domain-containing protein [Fusobacterium gastrosuis]|uniref:autotransporter outer membrane beta-barrel domain-containing protein n=1 Tax=Fusobacterium gastrosuis TaxID=1755100 RepID=UPI002A9D6077|nr:autotransporter outer membrane beta-barrel domain-containing protein [Fusobacteriaceae bacterium]MDY5794580.1 autotransporter outer membrane beta-barrel domain-containing protein [Fusobacterium gastrosuis]